MKLEMSPSPTVTTVASYDTEVLRHQSTRVLIQQKGSHRYLSAGGVWAADIEQAASFRSGSAAVEQILKQKLEKVHLVLIREIRVSEVIPVNASVCG